MILTLIITFAFFLNKCSKKKKLLEELEQNLSTLQKQKREDETALLKKEQGVEKEILALQHTITDLERKIQEGTKNQVVAKIEALEKKRQNHSHS
ncbi:hypothetical protein MNB_SV-3-467 [hydrothermal vent metagenome]|uniref:Uncharacterized protein n=1 Tax=hydrothermal vent metagenome TaxID=652676 RepID=A0A1W1CYN0_9ZZZZ